MQGRWLMADPIRTNSQSISTCKCQDHPCLHLKCHHKKFNKALTSSCSQCSKGKTLYLDRLRKWTCLRVWWLRPCRWLGACRHPWRSLWAFPCSRWGWCLRPTPWCPWCKDLQWWWVVATACLPKLMPLSTMTSKTNSDTRCKLLEKKYTSSALILSDKN